MKLLLDTHVWLWWNTEPERLATTVRRQIGDVRNEVFLSAASVWEMANENWASCVYQNL